MRKDSYNMTTIVLLYDILPKHRGIITLLIIGDKMSLEDNKNVVRRFISEILGKGNISVVDELLAPNYKNHFLPGGGVEGFKQYVRSFHTGVPDIKFTIENMLAEGDQVAVSLNISGTYTGSIMGSKPSGKFFSVPGLTYYRLANGKIVEDAPYTNPDVAHLLGLPMPEQM
jgi:predicted ester cyclase